MLPGTLASSSAHPFSIVQEQKLTRLMTWSEKKWASQIFCHTFSWVTFLNLIRRMIIYSQGPAAVSADGIEASSVHRRWLGEELMTSHCDFLGYSFREQKKNTHPHQIIPNSLVKQATCKEICMKRVKVEWSIDSTDEICNIYFSSSVHGTWGLWFSTKFEPTHCRTWWLVEWLNKVPPIHEVKRCGMNTINLLEFWLLVAYLFFNSSSIYYESYFNQPR